MPHDAFLSYSHAGEGPLARELEYALQRFAKPWYKRRALEIFRDEGNLNLSPHLWGSIQQALDTSRFFLYLASPSAVRSPWVAREIAHWKTHRGMDRFIILLTGGELAWDAARSDFDRSRSTAIPEVLHGAFADEPFYLDMRWTASEATLSIENPRFKDQVARIAATLNDVPIEDMVGLEVEQHRRTIRIRNLAIATLATFTVAAIGAAAVAFSQREAALRSEARAKVEQERAEEQQRQAELSERKANAQTKLAREKANEAAQQRTIADREARSARLALSRASMQQAVRLIGTDQPGEALAHLAMAVRTNPDSVPARSWVSHYLLNAGWWWPAPLPQAAVVAAVFSPDGRRVATAGNDGSARVWDAVTGELVGGPLSHRLGVVALAFSPDGRHVVTASADRTARIWDADTGQPVGAPIVHEDAVAAVAFSPDTRRVTTVDDGTDGSWSVRVWNAATGELVGTPLHRENENSSVIRTALSVDGRYVLASPLWGVVLWDTVSGRNVEIKHSDWIVRPPAFSPDGRLIVAEAADGTIRAWDVATGEPVRLPVKEPSADTTSASADRDGRRAITKHGSTAQVWDTASGRMVGAPLRHTDPVDTAAVSPDGHRVVTTSGGVARIWHLPTAPPLATVSGERRLTGPAAVTPDGRFIVVGRGKVTYVSDGTTGQLVGPPIQHWDPAIAVAISPDGRRVAIAYQDDLEAGTGVWDVGTGQRIGKPFDQGFLTAIVFSPDGHYVATAGSYSAQVWDAATGRPIGARLRHRDGVAAVAFSPDGRYVVTGSLDRTVRVWSVTTGAPASVPLLQHEQGVAAVAFTAAGRRVVTVMRGGHRAWLTRVWDPVTGRAVGPSVPGRMAAVSPDGLRVVTVPDEIEKGGVVSIVDTAILWNAATGQPVGSPLQSVRDLTAAFSPDGSRVVTVSGGVARLWDAETGQPVSGPLPHDGAFEAVFTPDGRRLITASRQGTARVWQVLLHTRSRSDVQGLANLAEVLGGYIVTDLGSVVPLNEPERLRRVRQLAGPAATAFVPIDALLRPFDHGRPQVRRSGNDLAQRDLWQATKNSPAWTGRSSSPRPAR